MVSELSLRSDEILQQVLCHEGSLEEGLVVGLQEVRGQLLVAGQTVPGRIHAPPLP